MGLSSNARDRVQRDRVDPTAPVASPATPPSTAPAPTPAPVAPPSFQFAPRQAVAPYQTAPRVPGSGSGAQQAGAPGAVQSFLASMPALGPMPTPTPLPMPPQGAPAPVPTAPIPAAPQAAATSHSDLLRDVLRNLFG